MEFSVYLDDSDLSNLTERLGVTPDTLRTLAEDERDAIQEAIHYAALNALKEALA